jgi:inorganic pyrophosphatase
MHKHDGFDGHITYSFTSGLYTAWDKTRTVKIAECKDRTKAVEAIKEASKAGPIGDQWKWPVRD